MPIMRNPFRKQDENARPVTTASEVEKNSDTQPTDVKGPVEYQLSEINDSGVFLPPAPQDRKTFWGTTSSRSTTSSSIHRCAFDENEPFNISRESFDSYRRSFDISARSPVVQPSDGRTRSSLDSRTFQSPPRSSNSFHRPLQVPHTQEEDRFEDVNIDDPKPQPTKKRGIFARMVDSSENADANSRPSSGHEGRSWHHFGGRKRGQSGQGQELGSIPRREELFKPEKQHSSTGDRPKTPKTESTQAPVIMVDS